ncbi:MAG: AI-2E family transporter [Planctomyces sp.]|nr:AI-2E family transporter [Planctomyces sp.]
MSSGTASTQRGVSYLYMLAAFFIVTAGLRFTKDIVQPLLLSIFIAVIAVPVYSWLVEKRIASWLALMLVISSVVASMLFVFLIVMTSLADFMARQDHYADQLRMRTKPVRDFVEGLIPEPKVMNEGGPGANIPEQKIPVENGAVGNRSDAKTDQDRNSQEGTAGSGVVEKDADVSPPAEGNPQDLNPDIGEQELSSGGEQSGLADGEAPAKPANGEIRGVELLEEKLSEDPWFRDTARVPPPRTRSSWKELVMSQFDPGMLISLAASVIGNIGMMLSDTVLVLLTVVFILLEASSFPQKLKAAFQGHENPLGPYMQIISSVRSYLIIKTGISVLTGIFIAVWLWLFGVPYAGLWGMVAFLLNFIPNIGSIIAAVPALIVAWLDLGVLPCAACGVGYLAVNMVIGNIIEPRMMGRGMGLSALVVFCSMVFWGWVLGPVGMLLSVPLTMGVRVALESFEDTRWIATLLGG